MFACWLTCGYFNIFSNIVNKKTSEKALFLVIIATPHELGSRRKLVRGEQLKDLNLVLYVAQRYLFHYALLPPLRRPTFFIVSSPSFPLKLHTMFANVKQLLPQNFQKLPCILCLSLAEVRYKFLSQDHQIPLLYYKDNGESLPA